MNALAADALSTVSQCKILPIMWEELFNGLTEERIAEEEGVEFTEEQWEAVSDGGCAPPKNLAHVAAA